VVGSWFWFCDEAKGLPDFTMKSQHTVNWLYEKAIIKLPFTIGIAGKRSIADLGV
jgi:hypothetical protein